MFGISQVAGRLSPPPRKGHQTPQSSREFGVQGWFGVQGVQGLGFKVWGFGIPPPPPHLRQAEIRECKEEESLAYQ